ncbi:PAS domain S-box protein [Sphingomonas rubra]|uniref:histidine kinase n=1 Tax=Sphingomonas rubra TaxID=634430 RepID=A0A1I5RQD8_9SPHN|nr:PAS domain S-box protein [Sphingomonas rubra]SFP60617.1 PAS domain S-box-containing protein [Sphingomonas rubra]
MDVDDGGGRSAFLLRLGDVLRPLDEVAAIRTATVRLLAEEFEADRVEFVEDDADRIGPEVVVHPDIAADPALTEEERKEYASAGVGAMIGVPLRRGDAVRGMLFVHYRRARTFADRDVALIRDAAERGWLSMENVRARAALRRSETWLAAALDSVPVGVAVLNGDGRIVSANAAYRQFLPGGIMPSRDPACVDRWRAWGEDGEALTSRDFPGARAMRGDRVVPGQEMLYTDDGGREVWTRVASIPIYDEAANIAGLASTITDIDALKRGTEALRESEARARLLVDGISQAVWEAMPDGAIEADSPSWRNYTGQSYAEWRDYGWLNAIHPDDRAPTLDKWRNTVRQRTAIDADYRLLGRDGRYRWMNVRAVPLVDDKGRIEKWLGMNIDIDERRRLQQSVQNSERRVRALMDSVPQLLWRADGVMRWSWASAQWCAYTGWSEEDSRGLGWLAVVHADDRDAVLAAWAVAGRGGDVEVECRLHRRDGHVRWFSIRATPIRDEHGEIVEWLGTASDVDALRQAQERQTILVAELQHRTRNLIAVVQSLAEKTLLSASSLDDFEHRFHDRLSALARVQGLLSHATAGRKVSFCEVLRSELLALGAVDRDGWGERVTLSGPATVALHTKLVQTLALGLHELATNAVKYGALKAPAGHLAITWRVDETAMGGRTLVVDWQESGVPMLDVAVVSQIRGYGRELIERALPYQLGAETSYAFGKDGLHCVLTVPIASPGMDEEGD